MEPTISVIICAHNPQKGYIDRVLQALMAQTLPKELWELLLVDNASNQILSSSLDLSWHPLSRHIREEKLGLTPARLRGIEEAKGDILIFVDDDNVLDPDYLEAALEISQKFSIVGVWGGQVIPEFEEPPPDWLEFDEELLGYLACRKFNEDKWSNLIHEYRTTPCGAGLCVRKIVAKKYAELVSSDPKRAGLDRKGKDLTSCGDYDLVFTACDIGLGMGKFTALKLTHLIPKVRINEDYLLRLVERIDYSIIILESLRQKILPRLTWRNSKLYTLYLRLRYNSRKFRFYQASQRGRKQAIKELTAILSDI